jgi:hypothetical protein
MKPGGGAMASANSLCVEAQRPNYYQPDPDMFMGPTLPLPEYHESPTVVAERLIAAPERDTPHERNEEGAITAGVAVITAIAGLAMLGAISMPHAGLDRELNFHDMKAGITWERTINKHCWLEFGTDISGGVDFSLRPKLKVKGHDVFDIPGVSQLTDAVKPVWSEYMENNHTTGTVCNDEADMYIKPDEKDGKVHIGFIGQNPFSVIVSPDSYMAIKFTPDPNPTAAALNLQGDQIKFVGSFLPDSVKKLPGIETFYGNSVEDNLKVLLMTAALGLSQSACAEVAVEEQKEPIMDMMIDKVEGQAETYAENNGLEYTLPRSTYVVDWPTTPVSPESSYIDELQEYFDSKDMKLTGDSLQGVTCTGLEDPEQKPLTAK